MGGSGSAVTGPEGTGSMGAVAEATGALSRIDPPPNRVEEHAPSARVEQSVAATIRRGLFILVLIMLGRM
jgi:hypothetical protein